MVHGALESDEDESLSEFIKSESEIGDCEDEDGNQLHFCSCHHECSIIFYSWSNWSGVVFQDEEDILHVHGNLVSMFSKEFIWNCSIQFT